MSNALREGDVVVTKAGGQIVAVTRQDEGGRILSVLAESEPQDAPVAYLDPRQLARGCASIHCITKPEYRSAADAAAGLEYVPVYLGPLQRKPLTDEQIDRLDTEAIRGGPDSQYAFRFARAIERAHGIEAEG